MLKKLKAYIVEDDILNIELLKFLINKCNPNISIIGEATNTIDFIGLMLENKADILFLDIELGEEKNSLDILSDFDNIKAEIIIASSSKAYALKALNEFNIFSYILKPLNILSLNKVLRKLEKKLELEEETLNNPLQNEYLAENVIALPGLTAIEIIDINKISYLEADGKYTIFHLSDGSSTTVSKNLGSYDKILPKKIFFRIHHKYLININETEKIFKTDGQYCLLKNGKNLPIAKRRIDELRKFIFVK